MHSTMLRAYSEMILNVDPLRVHPSRREQGELLLCNLGCRCFEKLGVRSSKNLSAESQMHCSEMASVSFVM